MRSAARLAVAVASAGISTLAVAAPAVAAPTAAPSQCTTTRGTIVAVDFGPWGGPIVRGCGVRANGQPDSTGYALLGDGGFSVAGDQRDGPAFVCRLGSGSFHGGTPYPTPAQDPCVHTPPASASWSLWLAQPGATSWHYSDYGATSDHPVAGEVELYTFGGSAAPANSLIDRLRAHNTTPAGGSPAPTKAPVKASPSQPAHQGGTSSRGSTGATGMSGTGAASRQSTGAAASPSGSTPSVPATTSPSASQSGSAVVGTSKPGGPPSIVAARSASKTQHGSGSALPVGITVVIVAALGGLGGLSFVRRRRRVGD